MAGPGPTGQGSTDFIAQANASPDVGHSTVGNRYCGMVDEGQIIT